MWKINMASCIIGKFYSTYRLFYFIYSFALNVMTFLYCTQDTLKNIRCSHCVKTEYNVMSKWKEQFFFFILSCFYKKVASIAYVYFCAEMQWNVQWKKYILWNFNAILISFIGQLNCWNIFIQFLRTINN